MNPKQPLWMWKALDELWIWAIRRHGSALEKTLKGKKTTPDVAARHSFNRRSCSVETLRQQAPKLWSRATILKPASIVLNCKNAKCCWDPTFLWMTDFLRVPLPTVIRLQNTTQNIYNWGNAVCSHPISSVTVLSHRNTCVCKLVQSFEMQERKKQKVKTWPWREQEVKWWRKQRGGWREEPLWNNDTVSCDDPNNEKLRDGRD